MNRVMSTCLAIVLALLLAGCADTRDLSHAPANTQRLHVWHQASGERVDVIYRDNGRYIPSAIAQLDRIFRDRNADETYPMDPALYDLMADLRDRMVMAPDTPIQILSGYRSPESNANLAKTNKYVAKHSFHMKGKAADIRIPDMDSRVLELVAKTIQRGGVALYPDRSRHVHVDVGPVRSWSIERGDEAGLRLGQATTPMRAAPKPVFVTEKPALPRAAHKEHVPLPPKAVNFNHVKKTVSDLKKKKPKSAANTAPSKKIQTPKAKKNPAKNPAKTKTSKKATTSKKD